MDGKTLIQYLIEKGAITKDDMRDYLKEDDKKSEVITIPKIYSKITTDSVRGCVLEKFDSRDLDASGKYVTPLGVKQIMEGAFAGNKDIKSIVIRRDVERICDRAFEGCENLRKVEMTNFVKELGGLAFANCSSLEMIKLSKNISYLRYGTFEGCSRLPGIILPVKLQGIDYNVFKDCENLSLMQIPCEDLYVVQKDAFTNCPIGDDFLRRFNKLKEQRKQQSEVTPN